MEPKKRQGRPTADPKTTQVSIRLNEDSRQILLEYCAKMGVGRSEAIRIAILKLLEDI